MKKKITLDEANNIVIKALQKILGKKKKITVNSQLIGNESLLDSMKLVELCVSLEDLADEYSFEFNWTSKNAMSRSRGIFKNVKTLAKEFAKQSGE